MAGSPSVEMPVSASDYQSLMLWIKELEERIAELEKENGGQAEIITGNSVHRESGIEPLFLLSPLEMMHVILAK